MAHRWRGASRHPALPADQAHPLLTDATATRNLFLSPDRSFHRKIQEALLAVGDRTPVHQTADFHAVRQPDLSRSRVYGFEVASEFYFSKSAKQLTLDEAALLAGLPKSPSYYSPITHPDHALKRRNLVINSMLEDGMITAQQAAEARDQRHRAPTSGP